MRNRTYNRLAITLVSLCFLAMAFTAYSTYRIHKHVENHLMLEMAKIEELYKLNAAFDQQNRIMHQMHIESLKPLPGSLFEKDDPY